MFEWKDDYKIGVKSIDEAHKQLFAIVSRILKNFTESNFERNKMTCIEAIKYLKDYTIQHFTDEERYQLQIGYTGYADHKKVHDNMRDVVVPALEREMTASRYSKESIAHFVGACAGWLAAHVMIDDQAITGKAADKWKKNIDPESDEMLEEIFKVINNGSFQVPITLVSKKYTGHQLSTLFCYRDTFKTKFGDEYTIVTAMEESLIAHIMSSILDKQVFEIDEIMAPMINEIFKTFNRDIMLAFLPRGIENINSTKLPEREFYASFNEVYPDHSMLWRSDCGYMAICVNNKSS